MKPSNPFIAVYTLAFRPQHKSSLSTAKSCLRATSSGCMISFSSLFLQFTIRDQFCRAANLSLCPRPHISSVNLLGALSVVAGQCMLTTDIDVCVCPCVGDGAHKEESVLLNFIISSMVTRSSRSL